MRFIKKSSNASSQDFQRRVELLLSELINLQSPPMRFSSRAWRPAVDVLQTTTAILVLVELPGVDSNQVEIVLHGDILYISGERFLNVSGCVRRYQLEIPTGVFEQAVRLPRSVNPELVSASYKDGILTIECPLSPIKIQ